MKPDAIAYIKSQKPQIDVLGQWVYLPNARTGSTSITGGPLADHAVMHHRGEQNWERVWEKVVVPRIDDTTIFTFVRNPWGRVVSAWQFLREKGRVTKEFPAFISDGALNTRGYDHFFRPQSASFMYGGAMIPGVVVCKHETRQEDWRQVASRIGTAASLPHRNATTHKPYWEYYDTPTTKMVGRVYATEIAVLGYEFAQ